MQDASTQCDTGPSKGSLACGSNARTRRSNWREKHEELLKTIRKARSAQTNTEILKNELPRRYNEIDLPTTSTKECAKCMSRIAITEYYDHIEICGN